MPQPQLYASNQSFMGLIKEVVRGTALVANVWIPYKSPQLTPNLTYLGDEGYRGSPVVTYDEVLGIRNDTLEFSGDVHLDTFGHLVEGTLGGVDAVSGAGPYVHPIPLLNSATVGSQPPSYTVVDFDGFTAKQIAGAQMAMLDLDFTAAGAFGYKVKYIGQPFTTIATPGTNTYTGTDKMIAAWSNAVTIAAVSTALLVDGTCTIDRATEAVHTQGQQGPAVVFSGPCKVTGKLTFLVATGDAIMPAGLTYQPQALTFTFTDTASTHTCLLTMTKAQFENPKIDRGKIYDQVTVDYTAEANTTDAATGYSPVKFTITNSQSAAY
jgi:hypothetical protein